MPKQDNPVAGLICNIYRNPHECSNGGISSRCSSVTLVGITAQIFEPTAECPAVRLVKRTIGGNVYLHAEPIEQPQNTVGAMFGGTFIYSSDSRFPSSYPIALHDRFETQQEYNALSR